MTSSRFSISSRGIVPVSRTEPSVEPQAAERAWRSWFFPASRKARTALRAFVAPVWFPAGATAGCGALVVRAADVAHASDNAVIETKVRVVNSTTAVLLLGIASERAHSSLATRLPIRQERDCS